MDKIITEKIDLNGDQLDALKELGNIGAGNAATALSQLLEKKVYISIPHLKFLNLSESSPKDFISDPDSVGIAFALKILGLLKGGMLVLFSRESASTMVDIMYRRVLPQGKLLTLTDISAITETAHILCSSYLSAVGEFLGLYQLIPSIPQTAMDRMDKLGGVLMKEFIGNDANYIIPIENQLNIEDIKLDMMVVFVLEYESVMKILKIMKMAGL